MSDKHNKSEKIKEFLWFGLYGKRIFTRVFRTEQTAKSVLAVAAVVSVIVIAIELVHIAAKSGSKIAQKIKGFFIRGGNNE